MDFTIVTPSYNSGNWLKLCIPSVADQAGVTLEHIVQDSCSTDGTQDWLPRDPRVKAFIEKDQGMYDAVNRGWKRAQGEFVGYLNCDEQYLPGALKAVRDYANRHPHADLIIADTVVVDPDGEYVCHRQSLMPYASQLWVRFPILSSGVFLRRKLLEEKQFYFDTRWRDLGDFHWVMNMVKRGARVGMLRYYTSVFTETGDNMNLKPNARREKELTDAAMPAYVRALWYPFVGFHRLRRLASGTYAQPPFEYSLYTRRSPDRRETHFAKNPTPIWRMPDGTLRW